MSEILIDLVGCCEVGYMKRCGRCGAENKDESNFCPNCGEVFRSDDEFYTDYWESNGINCILPAMENNLVII